MVVIEMSRGPTEQCRELTEGTNVPLEGVATWAECEALRRDPSQVSRICTPQIRVICMSGRRNVSQVGVGLSISGQP
jgi:hypothetical protein